MTREIYTKKGYNIYDVASCLQKALRRGDAKLAGYCALELYHSGFWKYVWKRILTVSAEDCGGIITKEVWALLESFLFINDYSDVMGKGRIFIAKAVLVTARQIKNRDADHLNNLIYDATDKEADTIIKNFDNKGVIEFPQYVFDCHTKTGKARGKTKRDFFIEEFKALENRQKGLFDEYLEE